ncbi:MAG: UDP-N-acetylmuramoyl-L-alanine--D-glutamate ligase, partial [Clostridia bacterium]|nr:UDP-N-acetylmuramoyl-L-alanine--D-glutamate ligase [Clostridia bacterium]
VENKANFKNEIVVENTLAEFSKMSSKWFSHPSNDMKLVGVTGTNGKTTTVSLINAILKENKIKTALVGNVGKPITSEIEKIDKNTVCVTEISSFQLESVQSICPHISCVLNIAPDHLERHYSMENYVYLKKKLLKNQTATEYTVLNYDDEIVKSFHLESNAKPIFVSLKEQVDGAYLVGDKIYYRNEFIIHINELPLIGEHNVYNCMFAIVVAKLLGVNKKVITSALKAFKGVKHRIELVNEIQGVKYYNDSKATNTASTISAIRTMKLPTVLMLGGSEKGEKYDTLFQEIIKSNVKHVVLMGDSRFHMLESAMAQGYKNVTLTEEFSVALKVANIFAQKGDCVLLSPACASFDKFSSYEERGEFYCKEIENLIGNSNA